MNRRSVLGVGVWAAVGGAIGSGVLPAQAAGGACPTADGPACERVKIFWGPNHGHEIAVPIEDLKAKTPKKYVAQGKSDHTHVFEITTADWEKLAAGEPVRLASTKTGGHLHRVRLRCAPAADAPDDLTACTVEIGGTDGHELVVPQSHVDAKTERVYDIQGAAPHSHQVTVTAAHFEKIAKGERVHLTASAGDDHTHLILISLAKKKS